LVQHNLSNRIGAVSSIGACVESLEGAAKVFDTWKPLMEDTVKELRSEVDAIRKTEATVESLWEEMTALRKTVSRTVLDATPSMPTGSCRPLRWLRRWFPSGSLCSAR
jgi:hypothetical protein